MLEVSSIAREIEQRTPESIKLYSELSHQLKLADSREPLYLHFSTHCRLQITEFFIIYKLEWPSTFSKSSTSSAIVSVDSFFKILGRTCIQETIFGLEDIDVVFH